MLGSAQVIPHRGYQTLLAVALLNLSGCNSRQRQCERLVEKVAAVVDGVRSASSSSAGKLDQVIFSLARSKAELAALDLPDIELDEDRRRVVRLLEGDLTALRAFGEVSRNNDPADVEDLKDKLRAREPEQRTIIQGLIRRCGGSRSPAPEK
jgi:hypothetical protein